MKKRKREEKYKKFFPLLSLPSRSASFPSFFFLFFLSCFVTSISFEKIRKVFPNQGINCLDLLQCKTCVCWEARKTENSFRLPSSVSPFSPSFFPGTTKECVPSGSKNSVNSLPSLSLSFLPLSSFFLPNFLHSQLLNLLPTR